MMNIISGDPKNLDVTLVEKEHKEYHVVIVRPNGNGFRYSSTYININDKRIDKAMIEAQAGLEDEFDPEEFAATAVDEDRCGYGERFFGGKVFDNLTQEEAQKKLDQWL